MITYVYHFGQSIPGLADMSFDEVSDGTDARGIGFHENMRAVHIPISTPSNPLRGSLSSASVKTTACS